MRRFDDVEFVRTSLRFRPNPRETLGTNPITIDKPSDPWHYAIIGESFRLERYAHSLKHDVSETVDEQIDIWDKSAGRVVKPYPNQVSSGIIELAEMTGEALPVLQEFRNNIDFYDDMAYFGNNSASEIMAARHLNAARDLVDRTRLSLYTHLWLLWAMEGFNQVNEFGGIFENSDHFEDSPESIFTYVAYPAIAVTIFACSALIEEVGCEFLNKRSSDHSINPDKTSPRYIAQELDEYLNDHDEFDIQKIEKEIVDRRDNLAHYISERDDLVSRDELEDFLTGVGRTIEVTNYMINELDNEIYKEYVDLTGSWLEEKSSHPIKNGSNIDSDSIS